MSTDTPASPASLPAYTLRHPTGDIALSRARAELMKARPYFEADVCTLRPAFVPGFGTFAVTERRVLIVDPDILEGGSAARWTATETAAVLEHELCHLFGDHAARARAINADPERWNIAADAEINDDLIAATRRGDPLTLPGSPITPASLGMPVGQLAEFYYHGLPPSPVGAPLCGGEGCGGAAGNPGKLEAALDAELGRSDEELRSDRLQLAEAIEAEAAKGQGNVPAGLLRRAGEYRTPPRVRWEREFAAALRGAIDRRPGARSPTYRRMSRSMMGLGHGVGRPVIAAAQSVVPNVVFAVDTSGSMSEKDCTDALRECLGICRTIGAAVRFIAIDAAVHKHVVVKASTDLTKLLVGGGGTDFRPMFAEIEELPPRDRPSVVVLATDGFGAAPQAPPPGVRVIWLLTAGGRAPVEWGKRIEMK